MLRFEGGKSESGKENSLCTSLSWLEAGGVLEVIRSPNGWSAELGEDGLRKLASRAIAIFQGSLILIIKSTLTYS